MINVARIIVILSILLILIGVLAMKAASGAKSADGKGFWASLLKYQGIIGVVAIVYGLWMLISSLSNTFMLNAPFSFRLVWYSWFADAVCMLVMGFVLGYGLIKGFLTSGEGKSVNTEKYDALMAKVYKYQVRLGWIAIALGAWTIIYYASLS